MGMTGPESEPKSQPSETSVNGVALCVEIACTSGFFTQLECRLMHKCMAALRSSKHLCIPLGPLCTFVVQDD